MRKETQIRSCQQASIRAQATTILSVVEIPLEPTQRINTAHPQTPRTVSESDFLQRRRRSSLPAQHQQRYHVVQHSALPGVAGIPGVEGNACPAPPRTSNAIVLAASESSLQQGSGQQQDAPSTYINIFDFRG